MSTPAAVDIAGTVTGAFADLGPQLITVGGAGIALSLVIWGLPKALGFFKKTAK